MRPSLILAIAVSLSAGIACAGDGPTVLVTPPGPTFSAPIDIVIGHTSGAETYAAGNSSAGGQGQTVDGVACDASVPVQHIHVHLTLIADGVQHAIPLAIGTKGAEVINGGFAVDAQCSDWLQTHDASGIVHTESPKATASTPGRCFAQWGATMTCSNIGGVQGAVTA